LSNLRKHFFYKVITNFVRIPISFVLQSLFPRLLGPEAYGNFDFLTDYSNKIINFFDGGFSVAFYTKLSQDKKNQVIVKFYGLLVLIVSIIYLIFVFCTRINGFYEIIWPGQEYNFILFSTLLGILTFGSNGLLRMVDACELTVSGEWIKIGQLILSVSLFSVVYLFFELFQLKEFYFLQVFIILALIIGNFALLRWKGFSPVPAIKLSKTDVLYYSKYFWSFSHPLLVSGIFALVAGLGERWILQLYGGSEQQGYFALSYKVGTFVFIFTSAMMPLLMREISKYFSASDKDKMRSLFVKNFKILYYLVSFLAVYVGINAELITAILGGNGFEKAGIVVSIMAFYPIHQTIGQINGTMYMSTERTIGYRNVSLFFIPFTLLLSYVFIAPIKSYGLGLGALGLACEMILIQFVVQNTLLFFNCRFLSISFINLFFYQIGVIVLLVLIGWFEKELIAIFVINLYFRGIIHGVVFSLTIVFLIFQIPQLIGLNDRQEIFAVFKIKK
jgi:O-antigen/teichoic acid export membrane protein